MKEEPFGPIVPILTFKDFDEVMDRANNNLVYAAMFTQRFKKS